MSGFEIRPKNPPRPGQTQDIDRRNLSYDSESLTDYYDWQNVAAFANSSQPDENIRERDIGDSIQSNANARDRLLSDLGFTQTEIEGIDLSDFSNQNIEQAFVVAPQLVNQ